MKKITLRPAGLADARAMCALIGELIPYLTLAPDGAGAEGFLLSLELAALERYLGAPDYCYQLGFIDGQLAGLIGLRDQRHVFHLFVAAAWHGQGVARQLWDAARAGAEAAGNRAGFTVNASRHAQPVYQRFGFVATGPLVEAHGIAYIPMRL